MYCVLVDQACKIRGAGHPYVREICLQYHAQGVATNTKQMVPELNFTAMLLYTDLNQREWKYFFLNLAYWYNKWVIIDILTLVLKFKP